MRFAAEQENATGHWLSWDLPGSLTSSGRKKLNTLAEMLARCDLDAIELGPVLRQEMVSLMGKEDTEGLLQKMDDLDFTTAYALLISRLQPPELAAKLGQTSPRGPDVDHA